MKWFERYVKSAKSLQEHLSASFHREFVTTDKLEEFADKLDFCQRNGVRVTINSVMVLKNLTKFMRLTYFYERGVNVTLKPQSDPSASRVVDGYTEEQMNILHNGMPQITNMEVKSRKLKNIRQEFEIIMNDRDGKEWYLDQAERFNAFNFNNFKGWICSTGYRSCIIRETWEH